MTSMSGLRATVFLVLIAAVLAAPAGAVVPTGNLLQNPGAEVAPGSPTGELVPVPGWSPTGTFTATGYGPSAGFPDLPESARIAGGANFFGGGNIPSTPNVSIGAQTVVVTGAAAEIDRGNLPATLSGWLGGYLIQTDQAQASAEFLDRSRNGLGAPVTIGPVTAVDRGSATRFEFRSASTTVPVGTRAIRVTVTFTRFEGRANDGYADNLSLTLGGEELTLADLPPPVLGRQVNVQAVRGRVLVAVPAGAAQGTRAGASQKGLRFVPLEEARQIPAGSFLDTTKGTVELRSATGSGANTQSGKFASGLFQVLQSRARKAKGLTELRLKGASFDRCRGRSAANGPGAEAAQLSKKTINKLRADAKGKYRSRGRHSAATVRGTVWITADRCDGTLTTVKRGKVSVRDFRSKRTITVRAGQSYLARAPR